MDLRERRMPVHEGQQEDASLWILQLRGSNFQVLQRQIVQRRELPGGRGPQRANQGVLKLAYYPSGLHQGSVCRWMRHYEGDARGRKSRGAPHQRRNYQGRRGR